MKGTGSDGKEFVRQGGKPGSTDGQGVILLIKVFDRLIFIQQAVEFHDRLTNGIHEPHAKTIAEPAAKYRTDCTDSCKLKRFFWSGYTKGNQEDVRGNREKGRFSNSNKKKSPETVGGLDPGHTVIIDPPHEAGGGSDTFSCSSHILQ